MGQAVRIQHDLRGILIVGRACRIRAYIIEENDGEGQPQVNELKAGKFLILPPQMLSQTEPINQINVSCGLHRFLIKSNWPASAHLSLATIKGYTITQPIDWNFHNTINSA